MSSSGFSKPLMRVSSLALHELFFQMTGDWFRLKLMTLGLTKTSSGNLFLGSGLALPTFVEVLGHLASLKIG
jgi:hypothetical protein